MSVTTPTLITFVVYIAAMILIGFITYRATKNFSDYILGGRSLGSFVTALSAGASDMSGWLLMGLPGAIFVSGLSESWIAIGLIAGAISFIPFVGTFVGAVMALGMALAQFPPDWMGVVKVAAVFLFGQTMEGNVLSPNLVGDRTGLHPVWIMFALLAGGALDRSSGGPTAVTPGLPSSSGRLA